MLTGPLGFACASGAAGASAGAGAVSSAILQKNFPIKRLHRKQINSLDPIQSLSMNWLKLFDSEYELRAVFYLFF